MKHTPILRKPMVRKVRKTGPSRTTAQQVWERDHHACVKCGLRGENVWPPHAQHHRRPRAAGGSRRTDTNLPSNLITLCAHCHAWVESQRQSALDAGLLLTQHQDPADTPLLYRGRLSRLNDDGTVEDADEDCIACDLTKLDGCPAHRQTSP